MRSQLFFVSLVSFPPGNERIADVWVLSIYFDHPIFHLGCQRFGWIVGLFGSGSVFSAFGYSGIRICPGGVESADGSAEPSRKAAAPASLRCAQLPRFASRAGRTPASAQPALTFRTRRRRLHPWRSMPHCQKSPEQLSATLKQKEQILVVQGSKILSFGSASNRIEKPTERATARIRDTLRFLRTRGNCSALTLEALASATAARAASRRGKGRVRHCGKKAIWPRRQFFANASVRPVHSGRPPVVPTITEMWAQ